MTDIRIRVDSDDADRQIRRLALFMADLRPFWARVVPLWIGWMRLQFETEGAFGGHPWPPLSPITSKIKQALGLRLQILQATGQAKQAASNPERISRPQSLTLIIDDSGPAHGPVLQYHQEPPAGARFPARPLVFGEPLPPFAEAQLIAAGEAYVGDLLRRI